MSYSLEIMKSTYQRLVNVTKSIPDSWQDFKASPESHITDIVAVFLAVPAYYTLRAPMPALVKVSVLAPTALLLGATALIEDLFFTKDKE